MLPCDHYLLTFTLPAPLRAVAQAHPRIVYAALLRAAAAAVQTLAADRTWVGGTLGILAVLHTWSRTLAYHPHAQSHDPNEISSAESMEKLLSLSKWFAINLDLGHFTAGNNDAAAFLKKQVDEFAKLTREAGLKEK